MNYIIETHDLTKRYGKSTVVNSVNMHILPGSVYGFVGENGSGKTTIMRLLMGLANPTGGSYELFNINYKDPNIYNVRKNISAIVEAPSLVPTMTAKENLKYAALYYGISDLSIIDEVLNEVGLCDTGKKKVKNFSLGMKQRLGIAVLLLHQPKLMLLDEPLNGLDPSGIAEVRDLILNLNKKGITFVISSHILSELEKVATHYGFISKGKMLKEISANELAMECKRSTVLKSQDIAGLENGLKELGVKEYSVEATQIKIFDEINISELISSLLAKGILVTGISTTEGDVENYYLNLIKEVK